MLPTFPDKSIVNINPVVVYEIPVYCFGYVVFLNKNSLDNDFGDRNFPLTQDFVSGENRYSELLIRVNVDGTMRVFRKVLLVKLPVHRIGITKDSISYVLGEPGSFDYSPIRGYDDRIIRRKPMQFGAGFPAKDQHRTRSFSYFRAN